MSGTSSFAYLGRLPASKSILNRLLVIQSFASDLTIKGESACDDVRVMREALAALAGSQPQIPVGHAGTVLRFMAFRAARVPGRHRLVGHPRLFSRPQAELVQVLGQLGVEANLGADFLEIEGEGWRPRGDTLLIPNGRSSQFVSGVLLNSWNLPFDLYGSPVGAGVSPGYGRMTAKLCVAAGLKIDFWDSDFRVRGGQTPAGQSLPFEISAELDASSAFAIAAVAAVSGQAVLLDFPANGLQPDVAFVDILEKMGARIHREGTVLKIESTPLLSGVAVNLKNTPDLFPVLAVLAALAEGESHLYGAPHLVHKESDRLGQIYRLLLQLGREGEIKGDGLIIRGPRLRPPGPGLVFDCDHDHRLAFAAAVLKAAGFAIEILHPEVVEKSFPEFWQIIEGALA